MAPLAGAFGGLLASAILKLDNVGGLRSWRMIFVIEGIITCGISIIAFFTMTDRPSTARWLTQEEKDLCIARLKSERVGTTTLLDKIDKKKLAMGISSPVTLLTAFIFLFVNVTVQGLAFFAPTVVKAIYPKKSVISQQLYTVPPYIVGAFMCMLLPWISWKTDRRQIIILLSAPLGMIGYIMFLASTNQNVRYGATFLITSSVFALGPMCNAQASANVVTDSARSSAIGFTGTCALGLYSRFHFLSIYLNMLIIIPFFLVMIGNIGGLISTWSFLPFDAPNYHIGNGLNLATTTMVLLLSCFGLWFMNWDNKRRELRHVEEELQGLSEQEVEDLDWKHPGFRWRL